MMKILPLALFLLVAFAPQEARKPNIVFIHADDLGYGDLSCTGQKKFSTPRLASVRVPSALPMMLE